jgi:hypothetical protein
MDHLNTFVVSPNKDDAKIVINSHHHFPITLHQIRVCLMATPPNKINPIASPPKNRPKVVQVSHDMAENEINISNNGFFFGRNI